MGENSSKVSQIASINETLVYKYANDKSNFKIKGSQYLDLRAKKDSCGWNHSNYCLCNKLAPL